MLPSDRMPVGVVILSQSNVSGLQIKLLITLLKKEEAVGSAGTGRVRASEELSLISGVIIRHICVRTFVVVIPTEKTVDVLFSV